MKKKEYKIYMFWTSMILLIVPLFLLTGGFILPAQYENTFLGELKYKCERLKNTEGKRIVIIGGSGVAFGIDSALIQENFPEYEVINFGMYAALGTNVMLDLSIREIREGDIVILSLEQNEQTLSDYFNAEAMWQALDGEFSLLACLDSDNAGQMAGAFPHFAAEKWSYVLRGETPETTGVYSKSSFNSYGDIESDLCSSNIMLQGYDANTKILFDKSVPDDTFLKELNNYADILTEKGATVWYRLCPMNAMAVDKETDVDAYYEYLQSRLHCTVIGNPNNSVMEPEWFYDTNFHLNNSGKQLNTRQVIRDIKAMLGDTSVTAIEIPEAPEMEIPEVMQGDNSDAKYFIYEENDGELYLTGLTEEGRRQELLTIPVSYNDLPVVSVGAAVFSGNDNIREIYVQKNILSIADYAFDGCTSLEMIKMENLNPEKCTVGQHLLEGTTADIFVNESVLSDYRLNYFWSQYASRLKEMK